MFIHKAAASIQVCWHLQPDLASANHRPFCWHLLCLSQSQAVLYLVWFSACQWGSLFLYSLDSCWWTMSFTGDLICMQFWPQPITGRAVSCTIFRRPMRFSVSLQPGLVLVDGVLYRGLDLYAVLATANHRPCCILYDFPPTNEVLCFSTAWTRADGRCPLPGTWSVCPPRPEISPLAYKQPAKTRSHLQKIILKHTIY